MQCKSLDIISAYFSKLLNCTDGFTRWIASLLYYFSSSFLFLLQNDKLYYILFAQVLVLFLSFAISQMLHYFIFDITLYYLEQLTTKCP
jgi:hypothetical protein